MGGWAWLVVLPLQLFLQVRELCMRGLAIIVGVVVIPYSLVRWMSL